MTFLTIDHALCANEGACIESCPYALITRGADGYPEAVEAGAKSCIRCGQCVSVCATGALSNTMVERDDCKEISTLDRQADPLGFVLRTRRSIRAFRPEPVPKAELQALMEIVRQSPTANNSQNLWWIITTGREETWPLARLARDWMESAFPGFAEHQLSGDADPVLRGAPHLALCCAPERSHWAHTDAAIAVTHLDLLLADRGFGACWAGVFLRAAEAWTPLAEALALPPGQKVCGGLFFGRPKHRYRLVPPRKPCAIDWR